MKKTIPLYKAKAKFSELIDSALNGEEIYISRGKIPVIKFVPVLNKPSGRVFGSHKGRAKVTDEFFDILPEEELKNWE